MENKIHVWNHQPDWKIIEVLLDCLQNGLNQAFFYWKLTAGWWYTYPSEKYESQLVLFFPIYGKI